MKSLLIQFLDRRSGTLVVLLLAAFLEVYGDSCFQSALYHSSGIARALWCATGIVVLAAYGLTVNMPHWDFGRLLTVYVVLFFIMTQVIAALRFHQKPTVPLLLGGSLMFMGAMVVMTWNR